MTKAMATACLAFLFPLCAGAAEPDAARFELQRSGDHFVRLDKQTGAMSICEDRLDAVWPRAEAVWVSPSGFEASTWGIVTVMTPSQRAR